MSVVWTALLFLVLLASAAGGWVARRKLDERHLSRDSVESIRLLMGMLLTFSAIVLGLLTSSAKQRYDGINNDISAYGAELIELDHRLRVYGSDADGLRVLLRRYTAAAIADTWPQEAAPPGQYPRLSHSSATRNLESVELGDMLSDVDIEIERLAPPDDFRRLTAGRLRNRIGQIMEQRWELIFSAHSTIAWPFLLILTCWLSIIFAIFGLTTPHDRVVYVVVALAALSIASPLYLILDYDEAKSGLLRLSSEPMRAALAHMDQGS